ncbi:MAG: DNA-directed RNA polymerase subunit beta [candidate division WOR-3 bacterium]|nr:DNA-directed RNA polymerase subunit beta [candidate division WOR-3 bacterium]MDW7987763.1 DNA-directed RNA polymerase subunit beta [candidate division WOR-3 bacterium]
MNIKDFSKLPQFLEIPDLLSIQLDSFREFLQNDKKPDERAKVGLEAILYENLNIPDLRKNYALEYVNYEVGEPKYTPEEAIEKMVSYTVPLKVKVRLIKKEKDSEKIKDIIEEEVFLCDLPYMTEKGTFIINGVERVVVNQLHRSPGVYFTKEENEYHALVIPYRGAWAEFIIGDNDILYIVLDRRRRINLATFFQAMGFSYEEVFRMFFNVGYEELKEGYIIGQQIVSDNNFILAEVGDRLTPELIKLLQSKGFNKAWIIDEGEVGSRILIKTIKSEKRMDKSTAVKKIYTRMRNIVPHSVEVAENIILGMLFDPRRFNLGEVGRYKLTRKLGPEVSDKGHGFTKEDMILIIKKLISIKENRLPVDDIDHLANRRVRRVGELLENQMRATLQQLAQSIKERASYIELSQASPNDLINANIVANSVTKFFTQNQLSQFMEQTNPLTELIHKRRVSALGPGGLTKETAGFEVRDVHYSHYGRICPIETPEGPNIGLIATIATYAKIDRYGFIATPYWKVKDGVVLKKIEYLNPEEEEGKCIAQADSPLDENRRFASREVIARKQGDVITVTPEEVDYMDITPKQLFSPSTILIPFLEHDDADRALMGANMQRQAVPLLIPEKPLVATGVEGKFARAANAVITASEDGEVIKVDSETIVLATDDGAKEYKLKKFVKSNQYTCLSFRPKVKLGQKVKKGDLLADGPATDDGQLALGRNVLVAYIPWYGYNYEDAIIVSEDLIKNDAFTSIQILEFEIQARDTKLGPEEITRDLPGVSESELENLDEFGIVRIGAKVNPGDILVGRITPKGETEFTPEERLLRAIFGEKASNVRDTSLRVESGVSGIVIGRQILSNFSNPNPLNRYLEAERISRVEHKYEIRKKFLQEQLAVKLFKILSGEKISRNLYNGKEQQILKSGEYFTLDALKNVVRLKFEKLREIIKCIGNREKALEVRKILAEFEKDVKELQKAQKAEIERVLRGDELPKGVLQSVRIFIAQKRKLSVGDKMAGRHGNKGVVSKILPREDMPYLEDGTPVDIVLNPLGVPSRMNIGQILEAHLGWAARELGYQAITPVFEGATVEEIKEELRKAGLPENGKIKLYDGRTGEPFDSEVVVGCIYMMKLIHMVDDKIHARSIGHYSLITQQPLGGKAQFGGQRFGEMEVWALEAHGAANTLQEMLTIKSDDVEGRSALYNALIRGENPPAPKIPASFSVLVKELAGLCLELIPEKERK